MISLIEQIRTGSIWNFPGGVHPAENKKQSNTTDIVHARLPEEIVLPVKQHIGKPGNLLVAAGDTVLKGQQLTALDTGFTLPVHAPTSGVITAIEPRTTAHPSGLSELSVVIKPDGLDTWIEKHPVEDFSTKTSDELLDVIRQAGISGMGGAGFPTAKKLQSGLGRTDILIVNAAECEPYITSDDKLLQEHAEEVLKGIEVVEHILQPKLTVIGIEDNKPDAIKALEIAAKDKDIVIRVIPTKYPSGGEKQLIKILTNKEVPAGGIPADIGVLVQNVGSLYSIKRAVIDGEPVVNRVVTLTGKTFKQPRNVWALLGTPVHELLEEFGYKADKKLPRLILGGPMMGFTLPHANVPITKTSNCILAPTRREISPSTYEMECIRCSACAEACPASLLPQQLQWHAKANELDKCEELNIKDCIECGACAFVCPSEIPLVQYYRQAKAEIKTRKDEATAAERAKVRFEEKNARMERDKAERENRFKKAADNRRKDMKSADGDDAIAAAIARVKAQKATADQDTAAEPTVKPAVAAAIARAKAKQAAAQKESNSEPDNSEMSKLREERKRQARERKAQQAVADSPAESSGDGKKDAVAAAIARAKAKKAQQTESASEAPAEKAGDAKKDAVAAAIARAKAKKAQQTESASDAPAESSGDTKKDAVAAAIARAKAKKAQQAESASDAPAKNSGDAKKDAVAAAIARAKAKKAQQAESAAQTESEAPAKSSGDAKKDAVAAAIACAKAKKAQQAESASDAPVESTGDAKKDAVAAAIARAKAKKAQQAESASDVPTESSGDAKKDAVAAAIARAKAKKAQQAEQAETVETLVPVIEVEAETQQESVDPKKAAVAAAIARAKAKKAQQAKQTETAETPEPVLEVVADAQPEAVDPKKAAVAAAIARAKAKKAQQAKQVEAEEIAPEAVAEPLIEKETVVESEAQSEPVDPKKAAVAAAIARAKARKAQQEQDKKNNEEKE
ncbi:electron transport complex subunit RsxC [Vibrio crassostreae]|uniref:electron transport complex subunit RsxC n=1 Tax=Vibrio crassostreae TaxID=246167 RepID=UPI00104ABE24|nr:electron transport complex subunit RsxC [Vibrio crassostreae]TCO03383.1 electron transport complex protein RnfC [Vibrio crassostreae]CAK1699912.1 SoxR (2Fe-2S) reducing system protein RsxC [Vibrio crassostreae]CAK1960456.1 SoxR (2Fe-2S) reducing system protein RsxC [Vibrio crassostreae]CAK2170874.1 SoxR (2Fe-2S) reducing system protein RsxC [Vibrio crassostreae]CAK2199109.1 SoxR (2Fe-2S) reducing system protein RsxC [Vibrio crassostreae]